jgi:hypothetical protein
MPVGTVVVLWLASTGAFASFLALIAIEVLDWDDADGALFTAGGVAVTDV